MKFSCLRPFKVAHRQIAFRDCTLKIKDGTTPTPKSLTVKLGNGSLTWDEKRNIEYILDRGNLDDVREGDQVPVQFDLEGSFEKYTGSVGSSTPTPDDALKNLGEASDWVSSDADACKPYAVDLELSIVPSGCTSDDKEVFTFSDFRWEDVKHNTKTGMLSVSGKCNIIRPSVVRQAQ